MKTDVLPMPGIFINHGAQWAQAPRSPCPTPQHAGQLVIWGRDLAAGMAGGLAGIGGIQREKQIVKCLRRIKAFFVC